MSHLLAQANALRIPLADGSVQCCVTSPPYWGLRDYGVAGQLGLEPTPNEFVANMVRVFREVKRVLREDGTCWVNMGDSYAATGPCGGTWNGSLPEGQNPGTASAKSAQKMMGSRVPAGLKPKDLVGAPWRLAFALQSDGWYLRSDIIWAKPNPMPESVTDRPTKSHEYLFLLSKSERYFFDADAVREAHQEATFKRFPDENCTPPSASRRLGLEGYPGSNQNFRAKDCVPNPMGRNIRSVWSIPTESYPGSHFATFPRKLVEPCIKAGTSEKGCCPVCGSPWVREVEWERVQTRPGVTTKTNGHSADVFGNRDPCRHVRVARTTGWRPTCGHDKPPVPCVVLDPFAGSGTTGVVALALGRQFVGLELNPEYIELAKRRISRPHAAVIRPGKPEHHPLFEARS